MTQSSNFKSPPNMLLNNPKPHNKHLDNPEATECYDLLLKVLETPLVTGGMSTMIGTNEGTLVSLWWSR